MELSMTCSALEASAYLHHLHLGTPAPERLAAFYGDTMDMTAERADNGSWIVRGPRRRVQFSQAPAKTLIHAGYALRDERGRAGLRARAEQQGLQPRDACTTFFQPGSFSVTDPDRNVIVFGLAAAEPPHRTGLHAPLQHLTLATKDVTAIEEFYASGLGFGVSDRVVDEHGKVMTSFMRGNHEHHNLACFYQDRQGVDHHSYEAGEWDRIRDWADRFAGRDIELMWGPGRHGPGNNLFIFIVDPDDNWIEVSAELEVVHDRGVKEWLQAERTLNLWGHGLLRA
jgi:catechol 2,3-dioxygenase